jgi:hypothetical protein
MATKFTYYGGQIIYVIYKYILWCNNPFKIFACNIVTHHIEITYRFLEGK